MTASIMPRRSITDAIFIPKQTIGFRGRRSGYARGSATYRKSMLNWYRTLYWCSQNKTLCAGWRRRKQHLQRGCGVARTMCIDPTPVPYTHGCTDWWGRKQLPESIMFADDVAWIPCGGREVNMTEYLDTWYISTEEKEGWGLAGWKLTLWISLSNRMTKETESRWRQ